MSTNRKPRKSYDPLAEHFARGRINQAQFRAGREFQKHFGMAENGQGAAEWLGKAFRELGQDGSAVVQDVLIRSMTTRQISTSRGKTGLQWERFYARRVGECLNTLATVYGFVNAQIDRTNETAHAIAGPLSYSAASRAQSAR
jgi:hypothetical protein